MSKWRFIRTVLPNRRARSSGSNYWRKDKQGNQKLVVDTFISMCAGAISRSCVWFAELFGRKTSRNQIRPQRDECGEAQFLQNIAQKAVNDFQQVNTKK